MLDAIGRDVHTWEISDLGSAGLVDPGAPCAEIFALPGGAHMAVDVPGWARRRLAGRVRRLKERAVTTTPGAVVELFAGITGDGHCVAVVPGQGCAAYRGPVSSRPLFYTCDEDGSIVVAQIRAIRAERPTNIDVDGLAAFLVPQLCDPRGTAWQAIRRLPPGHLLTTWDGTAEVRLVAQVEAVDTTVSRADLVVEFRSRLLKAVERCSECPGANQPCPGGMTSPPTCEHWQSRVYADSHTGDLSMTDQDDRDHYVAELVQELLPADTAFAVLGCEAFSKLAATLAWAGHDDANRMEGLLREVAVELEPHTLEWLAAGAESPAGFLMNRVRRACREQS